MKRLVLAIPLLILVACDQKPADAGKSGGMAPSAPAALKPNEAKDPICKMTVDK